MIIYLNLNEKGECRKERGKGEIVLQLGFKSVIIFENTLTDVVEALECYDRRWLLLGKEERSKNRERVECDKDL